MVLNALWMIFCRSKSAAIIFLSLAVSGLSTAALGKTERIGGIYDISIAGVTVARGSLSLIFKGNAYSAKVGMEPAGIGTLFSTGKGGAEATGWLTASRVLPSRYTMASRASNRDFFVNLRQGSGHVRNMDVSPKFKPSQTRVKVRSSHRQNAMDPLSAAIVPISSRKKMLSPTACNRKLPVFDGWMRFDIQLKFKEIKKVSGKGYDGEVVVCQARWIPVAGHRPERKSVQRLAKANSIEAWFAPAGNKKVLIPYRIKIPTATGSLVVEAAKLDMSRQGSKQAAAK